MDLKEDDIQLDDELGSRCGDRTELLTFLKRSRQMRGIDDLDRDRPIGLTRICLSIPSRIAEAPRCVGSDDKRVLSTLAVGDRPHSDRADDDARKASSVVPICKPV